MQKAIKTARSGKLKKRVLFYKDNATTHNSMISVSAVGDCGFEQFNHTLYSPHLPLSILFCSIKTTSLGNTIAVTIFAVDDFFD